MPTTAPAIRAAALELLGVGLALPPTTREHDQLAATRKEILAAPGGFE